MSELERAALSGELIRPFVVTEKAMRPASDEPRCFYCQQALGELHKDSCVLVCKRVTVRMTVEYEIVTPADWDRDQIEFHRNYSSWCARNAIDELDKLFGDDSDDCMCNNAQFEYVGNESAPYLDEE